MSTLKALRVCVETLEILRRGHGVEVSGLCYPALNIGREALEKHDPMKSAECNHCKKVYFFGGGTNKRAKKYCSDNCRKNAWVLRNG